MSPEAIFYIIISITLFEFLLTKTIGYLNTLYWSDELPIELSDIYDAEKYTKSQKYEKEKYRFGLVNSSISFGILFLIIVFGGFGVFDSFLRSYTDNAIVLALSFFGIISLIQTLFSLPFSYYGTFVIEEKYGFNKMTRKLFFLDSLKALLLTAAI